MDPSPTSEDQTGLPLREVDLSATRVAPRHLEILRELLARDYLTRADWRDALVHLATMAKEGLAADKTLVALHDPDRPAGEEWTAVNSAGDELTAAEISDHGSIAILEQVRRTREPILTVGPESLSVASHSVILQKIHSVLAVPLYWWDVTLRRPTRRFGGCLYAHRAARRPAFTEHDIALVLDITRIAEPNLNLLRYLKDLEEDLERQRETLSELREVAELDYRLGTFETLDPLFARHVITTLRRVARADKVGLLVLGPTGSGKSHLAKAYHLECTRSHGPFITLDCSQVTSATTLAAELFGYSPNSGYANAPPRGRHGKAKLADGGTLFIDEIGSLPSELQQKLLRLIQDGVFSPLGSSEEIQVDLQVIAATNEDLEKLVRGGRFREDLFWRICEITIHLPPLNERVVDIPGLARKFLERAVERFNKAAVSDFSEAALRELIRHDWSQHGNIRGLEHVVKRAVLMSEPGAVRIEASDLHFDLPMAYGRARGKRADERAAANAEARGPASQPEVGPSRRGRLDSEPEARSSTASSQQKVDADDLDDVDLETLLTAKILEYDANVRDMCRDADLAHRLGQRDDRVAQSTLYAHIRELGLKPTLKAHRREQNEQLYDSIVEAIREHGSGTAAAKVLGITRDALVWRLRTEGKTINNILAGDD